jgi:hypothetical protein
VGFGRQQFRDAFHAHYIPVGVIRKKC